MFKSSSVSHVFVWLSSRLITWNHCKGIIPPWYSGTACALGDLGSPSARVLSVDWSSTWGNGSQMGGLSDRRSPLGGLLQPINSRKKPRLYKRKSTGTYFCLEFGCDQTVLLTLAKVHGGQKTKGQSSLFKSPHKFWSCIKITQF